MVVSFDNGWNLFRVSSFFFLSFFVFFFSSFFHYFSYLLVVIGARFIFQQVKSSESQSLGIVEDEDEIFELGLSPEADSDAVLFLADMRVLFLAHF